MFGNFIELSCSARSRGSHRSKTRDGPLPDIECSAHSNHKHQAYRYPNKSRRGVWKGKPVILRLPEIEMHMDRAAERRSGPIPVITSNEDRTCASVMAVRDLARRSSFSDPAIMAIADRIIRTPKIFFPRSGVMRILSRKRNCRTEKLTRPPAMSVTTGRLADTGEQY